MPLRILIKAPKYPNKMRAGITPTRPKYIIIELILKQRTEKSPLNISNKILSLSF
jgi:hypothetical protein